MLTEIFVLILNTVAAVLGSALLLRAYLHGLRIGGRNQFAQFAAAMTDWMVKPLRAIVPTTGRWDWASLIGAFFVAALFLFLLQLMGPGMLIDVPMLLPLALGLLTKWGLYMLFVLVLVYTLISLVNPHAPLAPTFDALTRPLLAPFRRVLPPIGGFDLSPIAFLVVVQILQLILAQVIPARAGF
jgi:YggT family protein